MGTCTDSGLTTGHKLNLPDLPLAIAIYLGGDVSCSSSLQVPVILAGVGIIGKH
jgi:hypothetical protein